VLRTVLIVLGVAAATAIITALTTGDNHTTQSIPTTTFCSFCDGGIIRRH
jgi:hypothetical protein